eukprot:1158458-Pelagomonas_calceolata.AAC.2
MHMTCSRFCSLALDWPLLCFGRRYPSSQLVMCVEILVCRQYSAALATWSPLASCMHSYAQCKRLRDASCPWHRH